MKYFTLLFGILIGISLVLASQFFQRSCEECRIASADTKAISGAIAHFFSSKGELPLSIEELDKYFSSPPIDPWGKQYYYARENSTGGQICYLVWSFGSNHQSHSSVIHQNMVATQNCITSQSSSQPSAAGTAQSAAPN